MKSTPKTSRITLIVLASVSAAICYPPFVVAFSPRINTIRGFVSELTWQEQVIRSKDPSPSNAAMRWIVVEQHSAYLRNNRLRMSPSPSPSTGKLQNNTQPVLLDAEETLSFTTPTVNSNEGADDNAKIAFQGKKEEGLIGSNSTGTELSSSIAPLTNARTEKVASVSDAATSDEVSVPPNVQSASKTDIPPASIATNNTTTGIGGKDGFVYDVNKLKRNLVQEAVRENKKELLLLLSAPTSSTVDNRTSWRSPANKRKDAAGNYRGDDKLIGKKTRDDAIEEKLAVLLQSNPVSTTTDSNLLDGKWEFAFASDNTSTLLDTSRFVFRRSPRRSLAASNATTNFQEEKSPRQKSATTRGGPWRFQTGTTTESPFRSSTRHIHLENLDDEEDPYVVDSTIFWNGLWSIQRRYNVSGLTRTCLDLELHTTTLLVCGKETKTQERSSSHGSSSPITIQVLYLDGNLCICTTGFGLDGPLHVYTKSETWVKSKERSRRKGRLLVEMASWLSTLHSPLGIRRRITNILPWQQKKNALDENATIELDEETNRILLRREYGDKNDPSKLTVWRIGDVGSNLNEDDAAAWDGDQDPFVHLSADERQKMMRKMSIEEIEEAGRAQKLVSSEKQRRLQYHRKNKQFKKPSLLE